MSPRIVIGCGVYNDAQYLHETIPAMLAQTMPDFGLLLFDNGSTDDTWAILQSYAYFDPRIRLLRSATNLRCPDSANLGWGAALDWWPDCQWFVGAGADDVMDADYLEAILAAADANPDANCIFSPMRFIGHPDRGVWRYPPYDAARTHQKLMVPGWRAFTRTLWLALGGEYTGLNEGSDWEWVCRAAVCGVLRPFQLENPHVSLRVRADRKSQSELADRGALLTRMNALMMQGVPA
jgi:glycosyltransferase involved in cell wall biosynthesis